jgi:thiol:disulfide interchange protein
MSNLIDIEELQQHIDEKEELFVHCSASWNVRLDVQLEALLAEARVSSKQIQVVCLDTDDPRTWAALREWGVLNLPALVFFRGGCRVGTIIGLRALPELERLLAGWYGPQTQPN